MKATDIVLGTSWEDGDLTCLARIVVDGANMVQADLTSIARKIYDLGSATPTVAIDSSVPVVADVVFDNLQTDGRWSEDATGYNFRERIGGAKFATGDRSYRIEYWFTGASGELFPVIFKVYAQATYKD